MEHKYNKDIIDFIQRLVQTPSVNGVDSEKTIVMLIAKEAKRLDLPFEIISRNKKHPNIFVGKSFGSKSGLLLVSHMDTTGVGDKTKWLHKPFAGDIEDNKLFGRGAIDNKAGIALSLYTLKVLKDEGKLNLAKFVGVSDEEGGADSVYGARYLLDKGLNAKAAIYTYPGNDTITIGHRGQVKLWISVTGESAHSGSKGWQEGIKGASAIDALIRFLVKLNDIQMKGVHKSFPNYYFKQTILSINGGSTTSLVPDKAKALIDARLLPNHSNQEYIDKIMRLTKQFETKKIKFFVKIQTNLPASIINNDETIVKVLEKLSKQVLKNTPEIRGCGPANEGYMFINAGIPTICGFGVSGNGVHSHNEYLEINSIDKILEIYRQTALEL